MTVRAMVEVENDGGDEQRCADLQYCSEVILSEQWKTIGRHYFRRELLKDRHSQEDCDA